MQHLRGLLSRPIMLNILIHDSNAGTEGTLSKFAGSTKLEVVADAPVECAAIQRDLVRVEK